MTDVRLVDLDVFKRYSLAIRQEAAPAEEVLAVLDATRRQVLAAAGGDGTEPEEAVEPEKAIEAEEPVEAQEAVEAPRPAVRPARRRVRRTTGASPGSGQ